MRNPENQPQHKAESQNLLKSLTRSATNLLPVATHKESREKPSELSDEEVASRFGGLSESYHLPASVSDEPYDGKHIELFAEKNEIQPSPENIHKLGTLGLKNTRTEYPRTGAEYKLFKD